MTKTLEQIQEENRKLIILANNPEAKSYKEALKMEVYSSNNIYNPALFDYREDLRSDVILLGKPLTLDRLLRAFPSFVKLKTFQDESKLGIKHYLFKDVSEDGSIQLEPNGEINVCWDLTKPTLEEQTEETQIAINELLTKI